MRVVKDSIVRTHYYDEHGTESIITDTIEQYHYDSEEEKNNHKKQMEAKGFIDSGQVRENIADMTNPVYVWFGSYCKRSERKVMDNILLQAANAADV